jgi:subtilisin family serine protease
VSDKYSSALIGFSAVMLPETVRNLQGRPGVEVVRSKRMRLAATQARPPFGLDRLGQRLLPLDRYYGSNLTGQGVHVYVVDTGIMGSNVQFADSLGGSRVAAGFDAINAGKDGREDCEGHGTHVAGTIGATKYGIAKNVTLHPVRVVGCNHLTDTDHVLAGLDWIIANATAPAIVNMSLSGPRYPALDAAVARGIKKGLIFVVAAGNVDDGHSNPDACRASPARVGAAITVGAMDPGKDRIAPFSFRGGCVDLFAPGVNILSARNDSHNYGALMDGTSMAAAHAAGVAALYLEACNRLNIKPPAKDVWKALNAVAGVPGLGNWKGFIKHPWGSPNKLLYWGAAAQPASQPLSSSPMCMRSPLSL